MLLFGFGVVGVTTHEIGFHGSTPPNLERVMSVRELLCEALAGAALSLVAIVVGCKTVIAVAGWWLQLQ